tara:strand:+ start:132 stop:1079 length:948 start_codon:yes stop_codon:yes gene_type:complete
MTKPVLLAAGCSFTAPNNWRYYDKYGVKELKTWPQVLADIIKDKHGIDYAVHNTARGGSSLAKSIDRLQTAIFSDKYENDWNEWIKCDIKPHPENLIVLGLTDWLREFSTWTYSDFNPAVLYMHLLSGSIKKGEHPSVSLDDLDDHITDRPKDDDGALRIAGEMGIEPFLRNWLNDFYVKDEYRIRRIHYAFQQIYSVITMAKALGFKVLVYQLLVPFPPHEHFLKSFGYENPQNQTMDEWLIDHMHSVPLYDVLRKEESIIGFPFVDVLGGYSYESAVYNDHEKHDIIPGDGHPNQLGHKVIAKEFYNAWKNTA